MPKRKRPETFAEMVTRLLKRAKMSQKALAKALHLSTAYVSDVLAGIRGPFAAARIGPLSLALGCTDDEYQQLVDRAEEERETAIPRHLVALGLVDKCGGVEAAATYLRAVGAKAGRS